MNSPSAHPPLAPRLASPALVKLGRRPRRRDYLPTSRADMEARGWDQLDVIFVSGDAYVDHPSFATALLGRVLEAAGYRVGVIAQPAWKSVEPFLELGVPRLFWAVSAGNMDSMINHYTANRKRRSDDAYSPGGRAGQRPDRATNVYCQRCREANKRLLPKGARAPLVVAGGVEASLRRLAHYDYWSDSVKPSLLVSSKADFIGFGMGEWLIAEIARRLDEGGSRDDLKQLRGLAWLAGARETLPEDCLELPSFEEVRDDKRAFARATHRHHKETNPLNARRLLQRHGTRTVVQNPPTLPLSEADMDAVYDLPYQRQPHPDYSEAIPAFTTVRDSVTIMRGCFGGCNFCSITAHQGRVIQSRSKGSIVREIETLAKTPGFKGTVSDIGGPTANMYKMRCTRPDLEENCRRASCVHPNICPILGTDHGPLIELMQAARAVPGVKKVNVASGVRTDLAQRSPAYLRELAAHHVGGHLKVAPEHCSPRVLKAMRKPGVEDFDGFAEAFMEASRAVGKEQYLVPYFIGSHPGADLDDMIELAVFLKQRGYKPRQVQDFIPSPMDVAAAMYWTGLDPATLEPLPVAKRLRDRKMHRALMQFFKPENYFAVREALERRGRTDLIGADRSCLIPARAPRAALEARRRAADRELAVSEERSLGDRGWDLPEASAGTAEPQVPGRTVGYRPGRKGRGRRRPPRRDR